MRRTLLFAPFNEAGGGQGKVSGDDRTRSQEVGLNMEDKKKTFSLVPVSRNRDLALEISKVNLKIK